MNICPTCGYRAIRNDMFAKHLKIHDVAPVVEEPVAPVDNSIILHFTKAVEVYINGRPYVGKDIKVDNMNVASEIVRIAREAYGPTILL